MSTPYHAPVLVTGGAGFIGSHLCDALVAGGREVICLDNLSTGRRRNIAHLEGDARFRFVEGDLADRPLLRALVKPGTDVVHLAALGSVPRSISDPLATEQANLTGFLHVLEAARHGGARRLVYASSSSVYGDSPALPKREGQEGRPLSPYAVTKLMDEVYAGVYHRLHGMDLIGLRFFNVFGERQDPEGPYAAAIPKFIRAFLHHEAPLLNGDGGQTRDFTYVGNAVEAVRCALGTAHPEAPGAVVNIAYGSSCDLRSLVAQLKERLSRLDPAVAGIEAAHGPDRPGDVRASLADITLAGRLLGYRPLVSLPEGLDRVVPWYFEQARSGALV